MNGIRVVLFDLDDTLFAHRAAVSSGIQRYAATLGEPYGTMEAVDLVARDDAWQMLVRLRRTQARGGIGSADGWLVVRGSGSGAAVGAWAARPGIPWVTDIEARPTRPCLAGGPGAEAACGR